MKREKGITLVALVITVIVLIILAAVSIKAAMNGGLIINAKTAKEKWETGETEENGKLASLLAEIEGKYVESENGQLTLQNSTGKSLKNYRIYGNTVDGESVGDRTKNLFDISTSKGLESAYAGVTSKVENDKIITEVNVQVRTVLLKLGTFKAGTYTFSYDKFLKNDGNETKFSALKIGETVNSLTESMALSGKQATFTLEKEETVWVFHSGLSGAATPAVLSGVQVEEGDSATKYEPYGKYKVPVTVSGENVEPVTTNIYLNEPLRKIEDKADYIDFKNQKVVRYIKEENGELSLIENGPTEETVTLPEIPTFEGTTYITVDTTVVPSKIEVNYESE